MTRIPALLGLILALAVCAAGHASPLFDDTSVLAITLEGPLSTAINDTEDRLERAFSVSVNGEDIEVDVRIRGKSRVVHCRFPPLRLDFTSEAVAGSVLANQDKLKLVTHCKNRPDFEQNVLEEYAAYRLLNVLTDISFRARLLQVRYVDTEKPGSEPLTRFGFVVESSEELARRVDGEVLAVRDVTRTMLDARQAALVYVFQYLIGNTDWSLVRFFDDDYCCHNGHLIRVGESNYYVPYDFDMSGLVSARYARPQPELRLRSVRVRRYRGYCTDSAALREALRFTVSRRDELRGVIADLPGLSAKNRQKQLRYIEDFFEAAANEHKLLKEFERRCL